MTATTRPYSMAEQPTSTGRALLARAFEHWCAMQEGYAPQEIEAALDVEADSPVDVRRGVNLAARIIGETIARGAMTTWTRPIGGGEPQPIPASHWELDDFRPRMARSALDPTRPFDVAAVPTHWIFVDLDDFNRMMEASFGEPKPARVRRSPPHSDAVEAAAKIGAEIMHPASDPDERFIRLPEVMHRTGLSRSTIYRRMDESSFPKQVPMSGNIAAWRESEVAAWLAADRR